MPPTTTKVEPPTEKALPRTVTDEPKVFAGPKYGVSLPERLIPVRCEPSPKKAEAVMDDCELRKEAAPVMVMELPASVMAPPVRVIELFVRVIAPPLMSRVETVKVLLATVGLLSVTPPAVIVIALLP